MSNPLGAHSGAWIVLNGIRSGADPQSTNQQKMSALDVCQLCGPFEELAVDLKESMTKRGQVPYKV